MINQKYALITSAYNEERSIKKTIQSVISQTILPQIWIIISDGSTDGTDEIVKSYLADNPFLKFIKIDRENRHNFCAKVNAINIGYRQLKDIDYNFIGILDADISFERDYFHNLFNKFSANPKLGIVGGNIVQYINGRFERRLKNYNSVAGAVQLFKRECYESTGGFIPLEYGGEDAAIEIIARMNGWEVKTFPEIEVIHYGVVGRGRGGRIKARFKWGIMNFFLGYHPFFHLIRCIYRTVEKPYLLGSISEFIGYFYALYKYKKPKLATEVVNFLRDEQLKRIRKLFHL